MKDNSIIQQQIFESILIEIDKVKEKLKDLRIEPKDYYKLIQQLTLVCLHIDSFRF
ncbi:hypothetical protein ACQVUL_20635 [Bacillus cytotoxicus]|uniref:hypothetical protein n=1 Tax=Bacillus cytotoxicus TaxID=580165 RepID=UPI0002E0189E|nr:hypothetical protein [Bacillus cytotoxicus]